MADNYEVEATIISLGEMTQIQYTDKNTGQPKVFTKFQAECQVGDELHTFESAGFNRDKLEVGSRYRLEIQPKGEYTDNIWKISPSQGSVPNAAPVQPQKTVPAPTPVQSPGIVPKAIQAPKPDFASRWREWNMHMRTSQMQASERVGWYVKLASEGKLMNSEGIKPDALTIPTIQGWISDEIDLYWREQEVRVPSDIFGDLKESE